MLITTGGKIMKKLLKCERGDSEIIGVILVVAITVALAAIMGYYLFGSTNKVDPKKMPAFTVSKIDDKTLKIVYKDSGGAISIKNIKVTYPSDPDYYLVNEDPYDPTDDTLLQLGDIIEVGWSSPVSQLNKLVLTSNVDGNIQVVLDSDL
jgi:flagellin-like protein